MVNRVIFIAVLVFFLLNAALCWGAMVPSGNGGDEVFEKIIDTVAVVVVVKPADRPDMCLVFVGVICTDGSNWYVYCANNPLKYIDPTGCFLIFGGNTITLTNTLSQLSRVAGIVTDFYGPRPFITISPTDLTSPDYSSDSYDDIDWNDPPSGPDDLGPDWEEDPDNKKDTSGKHRKFKNKNTGEEIRWDKDDEGDHWHRLNPNKTGKKDCYLDKNGNPISRWNKNGHLFPKTKTIIDSIIEFFTPDYTNPQNYNNGHYPGDADGDGIPDPI